MAIFINHSQKHKMLKRIAKTFLKNELGFNDEEIRTEYNLVEGSKYKVKGGKFVDVVGIRSDKKAMIECGSIESDKIIEALNRGYSIFFIPKSAKGRTYVIELKVQKVVAIIKGRGVSLVKLTPSESEIKLIRGQDGSE